MPTVTLRKRKISGDRYSLVEDIYPAPAGRGRTRSLKMYIDAKPSTKSARDHNKGILDIAGLVCLRKANELAKPEIYSTAEKDALNRAEKSNFSFAQFCRDQIAKISGDSFHVYKTAARYFLLSYGEPDVKCGAINQLIVDEFRDYLPSAKMFRRKGTISQNSAATYMAAMKGLLSDAYDAGYLEEDFGKRTPSLDSAETHREYPSTDELALLWQSDCNYPLLKEMAFFSAMTGLRFSDCQKLDRNEIKGVPGDYYLDFSQKKTKDEAIHPISNQAFNLIPPHGEKPFSSIDYNDIQRPLKKWMAAAGISKHITFHSFRHAYANILLDNGADIYTVSKMLTHKSIRSTQVYVTIRESKKKEAAQKIELFLPGPPPGENSEMQMINQKVLNYSSVTYATGNVEYEVAGIMWDLGEDGIYFDKFEKQTRASWVDRYNVANNTNYKNKFEINNTIGSEFSTFKKDWARKYLPKIESFILA